MKMNMKKFAYSAAFIFAASFGLTSSAYAKTVIVKYGSYTFACFSGPYVTGTWSCWNIS
jgi:hypothetical protein